MSWRDQLLVDLRSDEGLRLAAYRDTKGFFTIGYGHNLETKHIRPAAADLILQHDAEDAELEVMQLVPTFDQLTDNRKRVVVNMGFNLGLHGLAEFKRFLGAIAAADWIHAADEMLDSDWAQQVGDRAHRLANLMRNG